MAKSNGNGKRNGKRPAKVPALMVAQPHGGAIQLGSLPGHPGWGGRPREAVRQACLKSFSERIPILERIADGGYVERIKVVGQDDTAVEFERSADASQRIKAVEALGKVAMSSDSPQGFLAAEGKLEADGGYRFTLLISERPADE